MNAMLRVLLRNLRPRFPDALLIECPACGRRDFKDEQGRGGHVAKSQDKTHRRYRNDMAEAMGDGSATRLDAPPPEPPAPLPVPRVVPSSEPPATVVPAGPRVMPRVEPEVLAPPPRVEVLPSPIVEVLARPPLRVGEAEEPPAWPVPVLPFPTPVQQRDQAAVVGAGIVLGTLAAFLGALLKVDASARRERLKALPGPSLLAGLEAAPPRPPKPGFLDFLRRVKP